MSLSQMRPCLEALISGPAELTHVSTVLAKGGTRRWDRESAGPGDGTWFMFRSTTVHKSQGFGASISSPIKWNS